MSYLSTYQCPPILFIIFNRPDVTKRVFERIRKAQPRQLFIAADGHRVNVLTDIKLCESARQAVKLIDWDCNVQTLFRETNLGCKLGVSSAINWFFEQVEAGIILEDDCLPHISFFRFCGELLQKYSIDERVMAINGTNFQFGSRYSNDSYYFSRYVDVWGWATWRRAWQNYDITMKNWSRFRDNQQLVDLFGTEEAAGYWSERFDRTARGEVDTWDFQWIFASLLQGGMSIVPNVNLVSNLGFGINATHTKRLNYALADLPAHAMRFPLRHPDRVHINDAADRSMFCHRFEGRMPSTPTWRIKKHCVELFRKLTINVK